MGLTLPPPKTTKSNRVPLFAAGGALLTVAVVGTLWGLGVFKPSNGQHIGPDGQAQATTGSAPTGPTGTTASPRPKAELKAIAAKSSISVEGPTGAKITVDGKAWPTPAPTEITGLSPGLHRVRLELPGGVALDEEQVTLDAPLPAKLKVETTPSGAQVLLGDRVLGVTTLEVDDLPPDVPQTLLIRLNGYQDVTETVTLARGLAQLVKLQLTPAGKKPNGKTLLANKQQPKTNPTTTTGTSTPNTVAMVASTQGFISVDTKPWTQVEIDGELYGQTPLIKKRLNVGSHQVLLINEAMGIREKRTVQIQPDQTAKLVLTLKQ
jgi:hypothetical protein